MMLVDRMIVDVKIGGRRFRRMIYRWSQSSSLEPVLEQMLDLVALPAGPR